MAGMFYSLKEAAQRLGISEDQVKQLAKDGKVREFRDGSNLLFKIEEINALVAEGIDVGADELELAAEEPTAEAVDDTAAALGDSVEEDIFKLDEEATPTAAAEGSEASDLDLIPELEEGQAAGMEPVEESQTPEFTAEEDLLLAQGLAETGGEEPEQPLADEAEGSTAEGSSEEISLAQESGVLAEGSDISDMDTALTGEGVNVLGETDTDYDVTEDSMAETAGTAASASAETGAEASLEEIEDDVNLDSFGSGSGLLDLSLQADDTSLGGILDEIYTAEGGEGEATPGEGEPAEAEAGAEAGEGPAFEDIGAEAEHGAAEEEATVPEAVAVMPAAMMPGYAEAVPDAQSNILGMLLFLPLIALLYTAIVTVAAMKNVMPAILTSVQGLIPYIMGGGIVLALAVFGVSFTAGREKAPKAVKPAKDKKAKAEKPKKEKAGAEPSAKPAKEKKGFSLFGKKKEKK